MLQVRRPAFSVLTKDWLPIGSKFDAFASRIAGTNVRLVDSDAGEYVYETTAAGLPIVIERWNTRLGAGMSDCTISVQSA